VTDTPETDAKAATDWHGWTVPADFARDLERRLNQALELLREIETLEQGGP
jgi:hypothetical protein